MRGGWSGFDLVTFDNGGNPLLDSYVGAPSQVRGTDEAGYARNVMQLWRAQFDAGNGVTGAMPDGTPATGASFGIPVPGAGALKAVGIGAAGVLLALVVVLVGLLVIWKS